MIVKDYFPLMEQAGNEGGGGSSIADDLTRLQAPDGAFDDDGGGDDGKGGDDGAAGSQGGNNDGGDGGTPYTPSKDWDIVKDLEGFEMPKNITADNEKELLKPFIAKKYGIVEPELHPLAKQIQEMAIENPDITINDLVDTVSSQYVDASKMSIDQKIEFDLYARYGKYDETNNPDGLTEDDVKQYIEKLTKVEKNNLAKQIEANIEEYNKSLTEQFKADRQKQFETQYDSIIENLNKAYTKLELDVSKIENVYGIPVNQEDHKAYLEEFKKLTTPDKSTGLRGIDEILSNDITLYKMFLLATKFGEDKVMELITKGKESGKEELMKKLKITPSVTGTRSREQEPNSLEAELELLRRPAGQ